MPTSPSTRIGELDQRLELQKEEYVSDGAGGTESEWVSQGTVWAHIRPQSGGERIQSDTLIVEGRFRCWVRNQGLGRDLNETWRAVWNGRNYVIEWAGPPSRRELYREVQLKSGSAT